MQFPKTLAAVRRADTSQFAIGDALLAECGPPPGAGARTDRRTSDSRGRLEDVHEYISSKGYEYDVNTLSGFRQTAYRYSPDRRSVNVSFTVYRIVGDATADLTPAQREKKLQAIVDSIDGPPTYTAVMRALGRKTTSRDVPRLTPEQRHAVAQSVLADPVEAKNLMSSKPTRSNAMQAASAVFESQTAGKKSSAAEHMQQQNDIERNGLAAIRYLRRSVEALEGVRITKSLASTLDFIVEQGEYYIEFMKTAAEQKGTLIDEISEFLENHEEV